MGIFFYAEPFSLSSKPQRAQHATFLLVQRQVGQKKNQLNGPVTRQILFGVFIYLHLYSQYILLQHRCKIPPSPRGCCETSQLVHLESDTVTASQLALFCPLVE